VDVQPATPALFISATLPRAMVSSGLGSLRPTLSDVLLRALMHRQWTCSARVAVRAEARPPFPSKADGVVLYDEPRSFIANRAALAISSNTPDQCFLAPPLDLHNRSPLARCGGDSVAVLRLYQTAIDRTNRPERKRTLHGAIKPRDVGLIEWTDPPLGGYDDSRRLLSVRSRKGAVELLHGLNIWIVAEIARSNCSSLGPWSIAGPADRMGRDTRSRDSGRRWQRVGRGHRRAGRKRRCNLMGCQLLGWRFLRLHRSAVQDVGGLVLHVQEPPHEADHHQHGERGQLEPEGCRLTWQHGLGPAARTNLSGPTSVRRHLHSLECGRPRRDESGQLSSAPDAEHRGGAVAAPATFTDVCHTRAPMTVWPSL